MKKIKGFTLIELLIVVLIVSILSSFAFPYFNRYTQKTNASVGIQLLNAFRTEVVNCYNKEGSLSLCNGVSGLTGSKFLSPRYDIHGFLVVSVDSGKIEATFDIRLENKNEYYKINYIPEIKGKILAWSLLCNDFGDEHQLLEDCDSSL